MEKSSNVDATVLVADDGHNTLETSVMGMKGTSKDAQDMQRMGKIQQFKRNFSFLSILGFSMVLMSTWETYLGTMAFGLANGGTAGMLYVYMVVAIMFLLVVVAMAEMASMAPTAGGQYHWVSEFAPRRWQKQLSFVVGWLCVLAWQTGCAIGCFLAAIEIQGLVVLNTNYVPERWHGTLMGIAVIVFVAVFNTFFAKYLPLVEILVLVLHFVGFFAVMIPLWVLGPKSSSHQIWTTFENGGGWSSVGLSCLVGMASPVASLLGADAATHMSEELRDASKTLPRAMVSASILNTLLGLATVMTVCYTIEDIESVLQTRTGFPFIQVFYDATGSKAGATVMTSIVIVLAFANGATNMAATSRQLFAFARDKGVPFHGWFATVPKGWNIPVNAIVFTTFFASFLTVINVGSVVAFNQIVSLGVCALLTSYIISIGCVCLRRLQRQPLLASRFDLGQFGLPINLIAIAFLAVALVFSFFPPVVHPAREMMNWAILVYGSVLMLAGVYYAFWARHVYVGPVEYVRKSV